MLKKLIFLFAFSVSLPLFGVDQALDFSDYSDENINIFPKKKDTPFELNIHVDGIQPAKIKKGFYKGDEVSYCEAKAEASMVVYYCPAYSEGANIALGYTNTYLHWIENPYFDQDRFNTITFTLGGITKRVEGWLWRGQFDINYDVDGSLIAQYFNYNILLWGRYDLSNQIGLHVGLIAQTGMGLDKVYPILGADWQVTKNWRINLVYPVNISIEYALNDKWALALAGRNFDSRHRIKKDECHGKSVIRYQNVGAEFAVKFAGDNLSANLHAGSTLGGDYRIADAQNHHPRHYKLRPSGYVGGEVDFKF
ncbi:MAG: DUF6268 family outer membrane beta-barrel protein [Parachlamydia sp.]|nr:DUF6268 family outer membrane beta-barrel protein [Parachlamydia sp.]